MADKEQPAKPAKKRNTGRRGLTAKQEAFVRYTLEGDGPGVAYEKAYGQGNYKRPTMHVAANKVLNTPSVQARIKELKAKIEEKWIWERVDSIRVLKAIAENNASAEERIRASERVQAVKELNSMHGYDAPKRVTLDTEEGSALHTLLQQIMGRTLGPRDDPADD